MRVIYLLLTPLIADQGCTGPAVQKTFFKIIYENDNLHIICTGFVVVFFFSLVRKSSLNAFIIVFRLFHLYLN